MSVDYDIYIKKNILGILEEGKRNLIQLSKRCHSVFPDELKRILEEMVKDKLIIQENGSFSLKRIDSIRKIKLYRNWTQNKKNAEIGLLRLKQNLHLPHCLDYEWWFSTDSMEKAFKNLLNNHPFELPRKMAFLGAPILASYISYFLPETKIIILDKSGSTLENIKKNILNKNISTIHYNAENKIPNELIGIADMVFFDPPWYPEYYDLFMRRAQQLTFGHYSSIGIALFPAFTRPSSLKERKKVIIKAMNLGFNLIKLEPDAVSYETPFFEKETLEKNKISSKNWRKGDMIIFLNDGKKLPENVECRIEEEWEDFLVGKIKVKIKKKNEELSKYIAPKILIKNPEDAVLYSVSRRSPIRKNIDLWTSTNIGLKIEGWKTMSLILDGISKGKNLEEISETILLNFSNLDKNQIKRDITIVYQTLKDLLIMNENEHKPQHLAILVQPFLDLILKGEKTIETRFTKVKCPPFQKVKEGDIILLKKSGGLVVGEITAGKVEYFSDLSPEKMEELKKYSSEICADYDPYFWEKRKDSRYISFIHIARVKKYETPYPFPKNDRRAWLILDTVEKSCQPSLFDSLTQKKGRE